LIPAFAVKDQAFRQRREYRRNARSTQERSIILKRIFCLTRASNLPGNVKRSNGHNVVPQ
jgi:hypothetical protein